VRYGTSSKPSMSGMTGRDRCDEHAVPTQLYCCRSHRMGVHKLDMAGANVYLATEEACILLFPVVTDHCIFLGDECAKSKAMAHGKPG